jgi:formylmethanofuran--tetrahydromethanopterin N-formyltransferase
MTQPNQSSQSEINGVAIENEFAEAFDMKATRIIITAADTTWVAHAATAMTGFGTSVIECGIEIAVEQSLAPESTPDGRPGVSVLAFAMSTSELVKQIPRRLGQCVLTCPTTAVFSGIDGDDSQASVSKDRIPMGKTLRFFGDGNQVSKVVQYDRYRRGKRFWRIPVMDGEFLCEHDTARASGIGGGNFILLGNDIAAVTAACRAAVDAISQMPNVITPFPGGATRSGSKVGSKYPSMPASTNDVYCPSLRSATDTLLRDDENCGLEIVIDGLSAEAVADSMKSGIAAACEVGGGNGLLRITAGNYGGKLGRHHFHLREVMS